MCLPVLIILVTHCTVRAAEGRATATADTARSALLVSRQLAHTSHTLSVHAFALQRAATERVEGLHEAMVL
jgi:hypothetical protein